MVTRIAAIAALAQGLWAQGAGLIEGRIVNSATGAGISGAKVRAVDRDRSTAKQVTTDLAGGFRFENLSTGTYQLTYTLDGFLRTKAGEADPPIWISDGETTRFTGELVPWPTLRGRVFDPDGKPAPNVHVAVAAGNFTVVTDRDGSYFFPKIPPGRILLVALPDAPVRGKADSSQTGTAPTYYPSATESSSAQPITVAGGAELFGYDIRLRRVPVQRIQGIVLDTDGNPLAKAQVSLLKPPDSPAMLMRGAFLASSGQLVDAPEDQALTGDDGRFELFFAHPGEHVIRAGTALEYDYRLHRDVVRVATQRINVSNEDLEGIKLRAAAPFEIDLTAQWGDTKPAANQRGMVQLIPLDGQPATSGVIESGPGLTAFPGRVLASVPVVPPGFYPAAVMMGGRDVLGQAVEFTGPQAMQVLYKSDGGVLHGKVEKAPGATVVVVPQGPFPLRTSLSVRCDESGSFTLTDIPPGDYFVAAISDLTELDSAAFRGFLTANATRVKVEPSSTKTLDLRLGNWP